MTVSRLVTEVKARLADGGVADPRTEARDLVAALRGESRFWPSLHGEEPLDEELVARVRAAAAQRARGAPFAYCVTRAAFRHMDLYVDGNVLIPRQETELLVEHVLEYSRRRTRARHGGVVVDVGTGSGAIALALALEGEFDAVIGTDISSDAVAVARRNAASLAPRLRLAPEFICCDMVSGVRAEDVSAVVSNPPYIAFDEAHSLEASVRDWEPPAALLSGHGGMSATRRVIRSAAPLLVAGGLLALEVDARRASLAAELVMSDGRYRNARVELDHSGRERFVLAVRV
jgi:release factor glutamine methyltransferase